MNSTAAEELLDGIDVSIKNITNFSNISDLEKAYLAKYLVGCLYQECMRKQLKL
ncbi:MAG: hypothetical protein GWP10_11425 [Nitrospiraceae bacterium]|nr:hypothetical protein [Nitrospiraceae bacterium]